MRKQRLRLGIFPASGLSRSAPLGFLLAGARPPFFSRSAAVRVSPARGWCGLCALVLWFWSVVCVRLCVVSARGHTLGGMSAVCGMVAALGLGASVSLRRSVVRGVLLAAGKMPNVRPEVAELSVLGVPFDGGKRCTAQAGRSHRTAPARGGARSAPLT